MSKSCYMTEYIGDLLLNVFDGLLMGELEIERRLLEVKQSLNLSNEDFAEKYITNDVVRREIIDLFPVKTQGDKSAIDPGSEYIPKIDGNVKESPQIRLFTGYTMVLGTDYSEDATGKKLITEKGYENVFAVIQTNLLITRRTILGEYISKGVPSFVVKDGKISSKVIISDVEGNPGANNKKIFIKGFKYKCFITLANDFENTLLVKEGEGEGFEIKNTDISPISFINFEGTIEIVEKGYYYFKVKCDKVCYISIVGDGVNIKGMNACNGYFSKGSYSINIKYYNDFFYYKYDAGKLSALMPTDLNPKSSWNKNIYKITLNYGIVNSSEENYSMVDSCSCEEGEAKENIRDTLINLRKGYNRFRVDTVNCTRVCNYDNSITDITIGYSILGK